MRAAVIAAVAVAKRTRKQKQDQQLSADWESLETLLEERMLQEHA